MFGQKNAFSLTGRATVLATVAAVTLTTIGPSLAYAGSVASEQGISSVAAAGGATDISARRRVYHRGGGGGAAAAAAFAGIVGTGLAIAAAQNRRSYDDGYDRGPAYYDGGQGYYGGGPAYYGGGPYYGGYRRGW